MMKKRKSRKKSRKKRRNRPQKILAKKEWMRTFAAVVDIVGMLYNWSVYETVGNTVCRVWES